MERGRQQNDSLVCQRCRKRSGPDGLGRAAMARAGSSFAYGGAAAADGADYEPRDVRVRAAGNTQS